MAKSKKTGTPLTERELLVLAAVFARSNCGMNLPKRERVQEALVATHPTSLSSEVMRFCQEFMENDEHQEIFEEEAKSWFKTLKKERREDIQRVHRDIAALTWDTAPVAS